jgi:hypothetical protein
MVSFFSSLYTAVNTYIDVPFNVSLGSILVCAYACIVRSPSTLLVMVLSVSAAIALYDTTSTAGEMIKTVCLLPLGLGSVLAFLVAGPRRQVKLRPVFEPYVNFAVYGNIGMMVATPPGSTVRGWCCKAACVMLLAWILQQGRRVGWRTVMPHDRIFVFTAVSRRWVVAHAIYRFILLTLPCFGSGRRHRLLEVYSLSLTAALSSTFGLPFEYSFGMADTLVAPAAAAWSSVSRTFSLLPRSSTSGGKAENMIGDTADVWLGAVSLAVAVYAAWNVVHDLRRGSKSASAEKVGRT